MSKAGVPVVLGCAVASLAIGGALLATRHEPAPIAGPATTTAVEAPPAAPPPPSEADEVRLVVRTLYPATDKVGAAEWRWAGCHDKTVGFAASRACLVSALTEAETIAAKFPMVPVVKTACGNDLVRAHQKFVDDRIALMRGQLAWVDANAAKLRPRMAAKSMHEAYADSEDWAGEKPADLGGYLELRKTPCAVRALGCQGGACTVEFPRIAGVPQ